MNKNKNGIVKIIIVVAAAVILIGIGIGLAYHFSQQDQPAEKEPEIVTMSTLEKIVNVSKLSTVKFVYNGVATVPNEEKPEEIDYYVSYNAEISVGIDFDAVYFEQDEEAKIIYAHMPMPYVTNVSVEIKSLDYIFENDKANTVTITQTAYEKCVEDAEKECKTNKDIFKMASDNARNAVTALAQPIVDEYFEGYHMEFKGGE